MASTQFDVPVKWGNVSLQKNTDRISATIQRSSMEIEKADKLLCGAQLDLTLAADTNDKGDPEQGKLIDTNIEMAVIADIKRVGFNTTEIKISLALAKKEIDHELLARFACRAGTIKGKRIGDATADDDD